MTHRLQFRAAALAAYRALRADRADELGKRLKTALERLIADPGSVRAECSRWDTLEGMVWSLPVDAPDGSLWLILWAEQPAAVVEVFYVGPAPGEATSDVAWSSGD